ncbi:transport and Golgi organization protein 11 [Strongylocentrotus purpuratus]|uniref:Mitochondrial fission factor n=1 Tax=Strongylocentrotus purpuratus TaxID=7668 RepID=A0A7M7N1Z2_STRPU|nr:transport and Golgi organization protein 11 [Strongylocentrotus purpuratus]|eukprot:XP_011683936.1 PREDICTED: transport and Golgi organization protein 11 [Strongylocentrotus purpuratus]
MGSTDKPSIVNQLQGEMAELHHIQYSTDFSTDVNRKMQIPSRLSMEPEEPFMVDPPSPTHNFNLNSESFEGSPAHAMNVPERILIAGSDQHVGARQAPRNLDLDDMPAFQPSNNVGLTTPPRTMTLDEISFPTVGDKSAMKAKAAAQVVRQSSDPNSSVLLADNTALVEGVQDSDWDKLQRKMHLLSSRVSSLEEAGRKQEQRETIIMGVGIVYLLFRGLRFLFRSPYP